MGHHYHEETPNKAQKSEAEWVPGLLATPKDCELTQNDIMLAAAIP